jgi:hypothetical protein
MWSSALWPWASRSRSPSTVSELLMHNSPPCNHNACTSANGPAPLPPRAFLAWIPHTWCAHALCVHMAKSTYLLLLCSHTSLHQVRVAGMSLSVCLSAMFDAGAPTAVFSIVFKQRAQQWLAVGSVCQLSTLKCQAPLLQKEQCMRSCMLLVLLTPAGARGP